MCGIVGVVSLEYPSVDVKVCKLMVDVLEHRGPDDSGYLFFHTGARHNNLTTSFFLNVTDSKFKSQNSLIPILDDSDVKKELAEHDWDLFIGHRRLAIIDLTYKAHQPMSDLTKNIWVSFNGEIYNFQELRNDLIKFGHKFKSNGDTEVIVYSYIQYKQKAFEMFNGIFSFVIFDNFEKKLYLVRDRYGTKPLYYAYYNGFLIFASEVKSILVYLDNLKYSRDIDYFGLIEYFTFQNFFSEKTLYKDIYLLPAGSYIEVDLLKKNWKVNKYWDFDYLNFLNIEDKQYYVEEVYELFKQAVKRQLVSDVEIGSYLSGGIDTASIVSVVSNYVKNFKTFTVGFDLNSVSGIELSFDERNVSEYVSYLVGSEHYEMVLKAGDMERCLDKLVYHLEEPRVGQSYPNFYASKLASKFVKVVFSGTGGDEIFGGYPWRYYKINQKTSFELFVKNYYLYWQRLLNDEERNKIFLPIRDKIKDYDTFEVFRNVFKNPPKYVNNIQESISLSFYLEAKTFLQGLLLVEDKLGMAHSIETRFPFLDNDLVDFALKIPVSFKVNINSEDFKIDENINLNKKQEFYKKTKNGKLILRYALSKILPEDIVFGYKQGFSAPDASWFRGESIEFVKKIIFNRKSNIYNFMDFDAVCGLVNDHLEGRRNRRLLIWSLINFEYWLKIFLECSIRNIANI